MKLFTRYLNSAAFFDGNNDQGADKKTPAEVARENILANMTDNKGTKEEVEKKEEPKEEEEVDDEEEKEKEEEKEVDGETEEQKAEKLAAREERKAARQQRKWDKLAAKATVAEKEVERLKKQLAADPDKTLTEEEVEARATKKAEEIVAKRNEEEGKKLFEKDCNILQEAANKADKDFDKKINAVASEVGEIPQIMIGILSHNLDNENGGDVLAYLASHPDEYEDIYTLREGRMTAKLIRLSDKLKAEKDAAAKAAKDAAKKQHSKVPDPIKPINEGSGARGDVLPAKPTENMEEFARIRARQVAERRKMNGGL